MKQKRIENKNLSPSYPEFTNERIHWHWCWWAADKEDKISFVFHKFWLINALIYKINWNKDKQHKESWFLWHENWTNLFDPKLPSSLRVVYVRVTLSFSSFQSSGDTHNIFEQWQQWEIKIINLINMCLNTHLFEEK